MRLFFLPTKGINDPWAGPLDPGTGTGDTQYKVVAKDLLAMLATCSLNRIYESTMASKFSQGLLGVAQSSSAPDMVQS